MPAKSKGSCVVIDSDVNALAETCSVLKEEGYDVLSISDGTRALQQIDLKPRNWMPSLVVVDVILSPMSGFELVRRLIQRYEDKKVFIFMTSKYSSPEDKLECTDAGAHGFIEKPVTTESITEAINEVNKRKMKSDIGAMVFDINHD